MHFNFSTALLCPSDLDNYAHDNLDSVCYEFVPIWKMIFFGIRIHQGGYVELWFR